MGIFSKLAIASALLVDPVAAFSRSGLRVRSMALSAATTKLTDPTSFLDSVDVFIFDCDGVIWKGDSLIDKVPAVLEKLRKMGKRIFFVTNNSTKSRLGYKKKFDGLGLDVQPEEIFSSSFAAAAYLEQTKFKESGKKVYIIGEVGIEDELDLIGVPYIGALYLAAPPRPRHLRRSPRRPRRSRRRVARGARRSERVACLCVRALRRRGWRRHGYTY